MNTATKMNDEKEYSIYAEGKESVEFFTTQLGREVYHGVEYEYRHTDGRLFRCVGISLDACRKLLGEWLNNKNSENSNGK